MKHASSHRHTRLYYLYTFKPCKNKNFDIVYSPWFSSKKKKHMVTIYVALSDMFLTDFGEKQNRFHTSDDWENCRLASGSVLFRQFLLLPKHNSVLLSMHMFLLSHDSWHFYLVSWTPWVGTVGSRSISGSYS